MARYYAEQALGMLETVGMVPAIEACDKMLKAAEVELISYENVGSTLVTMFVKGDVAAVKSSVKAGVEAAEKIGKVKSIYDRLDVPRLTEQQIQLRFERALSILDTLSVAPSRTQRMRDYAMSLMDRKN